MDRLDAGDGRLVRFELESRQVSGVSLTGEAVDAFAGSDGMFFHDGYLFMVNVFSSAGGIMTAEFSEDFSSAELVIRDAFQNVYDRPTASAAGGMLWTVNSQLDHIIDDANGALNTPPSVPFQIVGVPLDKLFSTEEEKEEDSSGTSLLSQWHHQAFALVSLVVAWAIVT